MVSSISSLATSLSTWNATFDPSLQAPRSTLHILPVPVHVTVLFRVATAWRLHVFTGCHLLSTSLGELKQFAFRIHIPLAQLRWSRAGVPFFTIGPFSRDIALRFGATPLTRPELGLLVRLWRTRRSQALSRIANAPSCSLNPR